MKVIPPEQLSAFIARLIVRVPIYLIVFYVLILPAYRYWTS